MLGMIPSVMGRSALAVATVARAMFAWLCRPASAGREYRRIAKFPSAQKQFAAMASREFVHKPLETAAVWRISAPLLAKLRENSRGYGNWAGSARNAARSSRAAAVGVRRPAV